MTALERNNERSLTKGNDSFACAALPRHEMKGLGIEREFDAMLLVNKQLGWIDEMMKALITSGGI